LPQVNLSLKEIYQKVCPECQKKIRDMVKDKLADRLVEQALKDEGNKNEV